MTAERPRGRGMRECAWKAHLTELEASEKAVPKGSIHAPMWSSNTICLHLRGPDITRGWPGLQEAGMAGQPVTWELCLPTCVAVPSSVVRETDSTLERPMGHQVMGGAGAGAQAHLPVSPDQLVGMWLQEQAPKRVLHAGPDVALRDAPEPGVHDQRLPARHVVQQGIKLGAVADPLPHLGLAHSQGGSRSEGGSSRFLPADPSRVLQKLVHGPKAKALQAALQQDTGGACLVQRALGSHTAP